ncbi:MAG: prepilin-type N-terminal cleavage/methylation domain-containing protein [Thermodesulfobacteriota bacterium]|nr:prepilin-type N-terminal cleavage/methylation domain-containing protein [Thermodesulfobacteriota bacterium]
MATKRMFKNRERGFTLIEIIIVIVILGILAVVAIPKYVDMKDDAAVAACNGVFGAAQATAAVNFAGRLVSPTRAVAITTGSRLLLAMESTPEGWSDTGTYISTTINNVTYKISVDVVEDATPTHQATIAKDW